MFPQKDEWNNNFEDEVKKARSPALVSAGGSRYDAAQRDAVADDAQKKFGGTKGISSDMYFGLVLLKIYKYYKTGTTIFNQKVEL